MKAPHKSRNPVAKHSRRFNKSHVMRDRKKDVRRGYRKHKPTYGPRPEE